jgi:hypothetical protein
MFNVPLEQIQQFKQNFSNIYGSSAGNFAKLAKFAEMQM